MLRITTIASAVVVIAMCGVTLEAQAQGAAPSVDPGSRLNEDILKELKAIRQLLETLGARQAGTAPQPREPQVGAMTNLRGHALGRDDAPITMVEFTDLQCPFCRQYANTTFERLKKEWIDTGKVRYISRDFPLSFHGQARNAARAARCAADQGKYWEMRAALLQNANALSTADIAKAAGTLGLNVKTLTVCSASTKYDAEIEADIAEGQRLGVTGTPTFITGRTTPNGIQGPIIVGAAGFDLFDSTLSGLALGATK